MTELLDPTPQAQTANPTPEPVSTPPSTVATQGGNATGDTAPASTDNDTFTSVDATKLSPQDREAYNNMLRDYKAKTAEIAAQRKKFEGVNLDEVLQKASLYEQALQAQQAQTSNAEEEELKQLWAQAQTDPAAAVEFHRRIAQREQTSVQQEVEKLKQEKLDAEATTFVDAFANAVDKKTGERLRPDYEAVNDTGLLRHYFNTFLEENGYQGDPPKEYWPKAIETAWQRAKSAYDSVYQKGYQAALEKHQAKVNGSTELPTGAAVPNERMLSQKDATTLSVREAVELARQNIKIKAR